MTKIPLTLGQKQEEFTLYLARFLVSVEHTYGLRPRLREVQRTPEQQNLYVQQGKSKTKNSKHLQSLAADIYFFRPDGTPASANEMVTVGKLWQSGHNAAVWGGFWAGFPDYPHFEFNYPDLG